MWIEVKKVENLEGLLEVGYSWLLETYDKEDCLNLWYDKGTSSSHIPEIVGPMKVTLGVIIHGRLFPTEVTAFNTKEGIFVKDEVFT